MIRQCDRDSCVLANVEAIAKFFEPRSEWNQGKLWWVLRKMGFQPSFDNLKVILESDQELSRKYTFCVIYVTPTELPDTLCFWVSRKIPAAFSYPVGERVHCNTALCKDGDAFDVFDPGFATSANEWVATVKRISASELVEIARNKRDVFVIARAQ